jgi:hypothetical protein
MQTIQLQQRTAFNVNLKFNLTCNHVLFYHFVIICANGVLFLPKIMLIAVVLLKNDLIFSDCKTYWVVYLKNIYYGSIGRRSYATYKNCRTVFCL